MAETSPPGAASSHLTGSHNPFDDPRPRRQKGFWIAIVIAIVVHAALALYLWKSKFEPNFKEYSDDVTDVALIKPVPAAAPAASAASAAEHTAAAAAQAAAQAAGVRA